MQNAPAGCPSAILAASANMLCVEAAGSRRTSTCISIRSSMSSNPHVWSRVSRESKIRVVLCPPSITAALVLPVSQTEPPSTLSVADGRIGSVLGGTRDDLLQDVLLGKQRAGVSLRQMLHLVREESSSIPRFLAMDSGNGETWWVSTRNTLQ